MIDDPHSKARGVLFDNSRASLDADSGLALRATPRLRHSAKISSVVCPATIDGAESPTISARPRGQAKGRAFPVETHYVGRDELRRLSADRRSELTRARAAERADPGVPAGTAKSPHREGSRRLDDDRDRTSSPLYGALDAETEDRDHLRPAPGGAGRCWRPRSPRPSSRSTACASLSIFSQGSRRAALRAGCRP